MNSFNLRQPWLLGTVIANLKALVRSKKLLYQMTCRKPGLPPRCLINLAVPSQNLWLEFNHLYPQPVHKGFKDFVNHSFCFEVWIKYAHTFLWACCLAREAGMFSTLVCNKIDSYTSTKKMSTKNIENEAFFTLKELVQLLVSAEKGRFIPNESILTV